MEARSVGDDLEKRCPQPAVEVTGEFRGPQVAFGTTLGLQRVTQVTLKECRLCCRQNRPGPRDWRFSGVDLEQQGAATSGKREGRLNPIPIFLIRLSRYRWSHSPPPGYILLDPPVRWGTQAVLRDPGQWAEPACEHLPPFSFSWMFSSELKRKSGVTHFRPLPMLRGRENFTCKC